MQGHLGCISIRCEDTGRDSGRKQVIDQKQYCNRTIRRSSAATSSNRDDDCLITLIVHPTDMSGSLINLVLTNSDNLMANVLV